MDDTSGSQDRADELGAVLEEVISQMRDELQNERPGSALGRRQR